MSAGGVDVVVESKGPCRFLAAGHPIKGIGLCVGMEALALRSATIKRQLFPALRLQ
jgi:hypothetical protein